MDDSKQPLDGDESGGPDVSGGSDVLVRERRAWKETAPSYAIIDALTSLDGVDLEASPTDSDATLFDYVDPDALDRVVDSLRGTGSTITFSVADHRVRITDDALTVFSSLE